MEIVFVSIGILFVAYLFWQSYLLSQYRNIVENQQQALSALSRYNDELRAEIKKLKPF
jgi:cell division protein FtsB